MIRKPYMRGEIEVVPFSPAEDDLLTRLRIEGAGTTLIARRLAGECRSQRSPATVNMRLKTLAAHDEEDEA